MWGNLTSVPYNKLVLSKYKKKGKETEKKYSVSKRLTEFSNTVLLLCKCHIRIFLYAPVEDKAEQKKISDYMYTNF